VADSAPRVGPSRAAQRDGGPLRVRQSTIIDKLSQQAK
jgi:hypothetical protein